jgi:predicted O-linked N-acetylglucosamine transferase (SPINDLY family)
VTSAKSGLSTAINDLEIARQHFGQKRISEAEKVCRDILKQDPTCAPAWRLLSEITLQAGAPAFALSFSKRAVALDATDPASFQGLGNVYRALGRPNEAEAAVRQGLRLSPQDARMHAGLALALMNQGKLAEALDVLHRAISLDAADAKLHHFLGLLLLQMGRPAEAVASFREASALAPNSSGPRAGVLFAQHYLADADAAAYLAEARAWGDLQTPCADAEVPDFVNVPDLHRRLRIGYLSGDFCEHPVGRMVQSVLAEHAPSRVEVTCYSNHWRTDAVTMQIRASVHRWRPIFHLPDERVADMIRNDHIDILVDLSGHTAASRLHVLARRPAPVQAMWLGYFDTTGLSTVDYIIADGYVCPKGYDRFFVEKVVRLPHSWFCYTPPNSSPDIGPLPALSCNHVTFGCFNNSAKVTPDVVACWAEILQAVPEARLLLKSASLDDQSVREENARLFTAHGIARDRIAFAGRSDYAAHLEHHNQVDIALDPFPYNGGATTLDALWMGVPVIALQGERFASRFGVSILTNAGLSDLIAESSRDYAEKAIALARDLVRLNRLRECLREQLRRSPLCDAAGLARDLETLYRGMWADWCGSRMAV